MPTHYYVEISTPSSRIGAIFAVLLVIALLAAPFLVGRGVLQDLFFLLTLIALAQCWNLLAGFAGIISIGQQAFVGFGGYLMFALSAFAGIDPVLAIIAAGVFGGLVAVPVARVIFRLNGAYLAVGTWVVAEVFRLTFAQIQSLGGGTGASLPRAVTNESLTVQWVAGSMGLRPAAARDWLTYWLAVFVATGIIALIYRVLRSRQGLALAAIRDNAAAAGSVGVDEGRTRLWVYVLAGAGASLIGALDFFQIARISPDAAFSVTDFTAYVLFVVVIGGIGTIEGPIVGSLVLYLMRTWLADFGPAYLMLLGALAIAVMLGFPRGLWGSCAERFDIHVLPLRRRLIVGEKDGKKGFLF